MIRFPKTSLPTGNCFSWTRQKRWQQQQWWFISPASTWVRAAEHVMGCCPAVGLSPEGLIDQAILWDLGCLWHRPIPIMIAEFDLPQRQHITNIGLIWPQVSRSGIQSAMSMGLSEGALGYWEQHVKEDEGRGRRRQDLRKKWTQNIRSFLMNMSKSGGSFRFGSPARLCTRTHVAVFFANIETLQVPALCCGYPWATVYATV